MLRQRTPPRSHQTAGNEGGGTPGHLRRAARAGRRFHHPSRIPATPAPRGGAARVKSAAVGARSCGPPHGAPWPAPASKRTSSADRPLHALLGLLQAPARAPPRRCPSRARPRPRAPAPCRCSPRRSRRPRSRTRGARPRERERCPAPSATGTGCGPAARRTGPRPPGTIASSACTDRMRFSGVTISTVSLAMGFRAPRNTALRTSAGGSCRPPSRTRCARHPSGAGPCPGPRACPPTT